MLLSGLLIARLDEIEDLETQVRLLSEYGRKIIDQNTSELKVISELDFKRAVFLGSGIFKGIIQNIGQNGVHRHQDLHFKQIFSALIGSFFIWGKDLLQPEGLKVQTLQLRIIQKNP